MGIGKTARKYARQLFSDQFYATAKKAYRSVIPAPKLLPPGYYGDHGDFASFAEAATAAASAYDQSIILEKTLAGTQAIRPTDAVPRNDLQLFAALWSAVAEVDHAPVRVLDFGGALGAHFFRFHGSLPKPVIWTVVELPGTVAMAKMALQSDQLRFTEALEEAGPADIVIASGVLQFLPEPYEMLGKLARIGSRLIIDKMTVLDRDRITIQRVSPVLFEASFPKWYLSEDKLIRQAAPLRCAQAWDLPEYLAPLDGEPRNLHRGFLFKRDGTTAGAA